MKNTENSNIKLDQVSAVQCRYFAYPTPGTTCHEASPPAAPQADENKSCSLRSVLASHLVSHIQLILVPLDQCTWLLKKISFNWLGFLMSASLP